jgi:hypothetical protein
LILASSTSRCAGIATHHFPSVWNLGLSPVRQHSTPRCQARGDRHLLAVPVSTARRIGVTLREPLGRRVVLDSSSGVPLLPQSDIHLFEFQNYDPRRS